MKKLAFALLVLSVAACAPRERNKPAKPPTKVTSDSTRLAAKDQNGESKKDFSISLHSSATGSIVTIPFDFNTEDYTTFSVSVPTISAKNCRKDKSQAKLMKTSRTGAKLFWSNSNGARPQKPNLGFDKEQTTAENSNETIALYLYVPPGCTLVSGSITVKFKNRVRFWAPDDL